jgi:small subunit ribosomal protein S15
MALTKQDKETIVAEFGIKPGDTGSSQVQIALLTKQIVSLNEHLKNHKHDQSSRYGLIKLVGERRRHLKYLSVQDPTAYKALLARLGLRK